MIFVRPWDVVKLDSQPGSPSVRSAVSQLAGPMYGPFIGGERQSPSGVPLFDSVDPATRDGREWLTLRLQKAAE